MKWINGFYLICIFLCGTLSEGAHAQTEQLMRRADSLFASGNYFESSVAYERVYFESEEPLMRITANLKKAQALKQLREYDRALADLRRSVTFSGKDSLRQEVLYEMAFCAYMDGDPGEAFALLQQFRHRYGQDSGQRVYLLEGLVLNDLRQWDALADHIESWVLNFSGDPEMAEEIAEEQLACYAEILMLKEEQRKPDPEKARLWSTFIPGSGQLYAGEAGWGMLNAFSQLASLGAFAAMAINGYYVAGVFAGLGPFQSFYFGGIRQAGLLAENNKKSRRDETLAAVREFLFSLEEKIDAE